MGIVVSMLMITAGAIMRFAVSATATGFSIHTTGVILIVVGLVTAVMSVVYWASWGGFGGGLSRRSVALAPPAVIVPRTTVVREREIL